MEKHTIQIHLSDETYWKLAEMKALSKSATWEECFLKCYEKWK